MKVITEIILFPGEVRSELPWADNKAVKHEIDMQILDLLGPKTAEDMNKPAKEKVSQLLFWGEPDKEFSFW